MIHWTTEEQRAVVQFLRAKGLESKDIHEELLPVDGDKCLSRTAVYNWVEKFPQGRSKIVDEDRRSTSSPTVDETATQRILCS